ncbi:phosphonate ABC transporter substrate-binding protein [Geminicoccus flavidas]|uniref:phosphonate ABC transporter substrate-binding protein n=1 Tax=Geminicoccus flavidas TaxID=2506407 RepID=UPI001356AB0F|nr:phosphonate ABC transporter substrate-binding protein [Geminicoccus flavidas]
MLRRIALSLLGTAACLATLPPAPAGAQSWKEQVPAFRYGIIGGENEADRLTNYACFQEKLSQRLGIPVELYPASDYAGVMQGLIAGTLDAGLLGASGYAGIYLEDPQAVEPLFTQEQTDGSTGYYSVLLVRADSPYQKLEDLQGKTLAFADPNSTSGYLYPSVELKLQGYDPASFFGSTGFAGGHEQGVIALLDGQYDAAVTWTSGVGEYAQGYTSGNLRKMVDKGALDMSDVRILWKSNLIPNGPEVVRQALPAELKAEYKEFLRELPKSDPDCFYKTQGGDFTGFVEVDQGFYGDVIKVRQEQMASRRS